MPARYIIVIMLSALLCAFVFGYRQGVVSVQQQLTEQALKQSEQARRSEKQQQELSALLRARSARGLSTVLTSNLPPSMMGNVCPDFLAAAVTEMRPLGIHLACPCRRRSLADIGDSWKS